MTIREENNDLINLAVVHVKFFCYNHKEYQKFTG